MNSNLSHSPVTLSLCQNQQFFVLCDLEIWWKTLKNSKASLLYIIKLWASFQSHQYIQTLVNYCQETLNSVIICIFSCNQAALWMVFSVHLSVRPSVGLSICHTFLSHPSLGWLYVFSLFPPPRPPSPQWLLLLMSKPFELDDNDNDNDDNEYVFIAM